MYDVNEKVYDTTDEVNNISNAYTFTAQYKTIDTPKRYYKINFLYYKNNECAHITEDNKTYYPCYDFEIHGETSVVGVKTDIINYTDNVRKYFKDPWNSFAQDKFCYLRMYAGENSNNKLYLHTKAESEDYKYPKLGFYKCKFTQTSGTTTTIKGKWTDNGNGLNALTTSIFEKEYILKQGNNLYPHLKINYTKNYLSKTNYCCVVEDVSSVATGSTNNNRYLTPFILHTSNTTPNTKIYTGEFEYDKTYVNPPLSRAPYFVDKDNKKFTSFDAENKNGIYRLSEYIIVEFYDSKIDTRKFYTYKFSNNKWNLEPYKVTVANVNNDKFTTYDFILDKDNYLVKKTENGYERVYEELIIGNYNNIDTLKSYKLNSSQTSLLTTQSITTKQEILSNLLEENIEDYQESIDDLKESGNFITPMEYYASIENQEKNVSVNGYEETEIVTKNTNDEDTPDPLVEDDSSKKPIWFWLDTLKNWCTLKTNANNYTTAKNILYVWNGHDGWDSFEDIVKLYNSSHASCFKKYHYDFSKINIVFTNQQIINYDDDTITKDYYVNFKGFKLSGENKYINHNQNTFETITYRFSNKDVLTYETIMTGCPNIIRSESNEIIFCYYLSPYNPNRDDKTMYSLYLFNNSYMNSVCVTCFGDGTDKTIDDWLCFLKKNKQFEQPSNTFKEYTASSLIEADPVMFDKINNEHIKIKFNINKMYGTNEDVDYNDYAERWEK